MLAAICHGKKDLRVEERADRALAPEEVRVAVAFGGICGSDMHYFHRGSVGDNVVREPMVLGHEISGTVVECGDGVEELTPGLKPGMRAALDPSRPCLTCSQCRAGRMNLCEDMFFLGSAGRFPHVQGGFAQHLILRADQIIPVPEDTDLLKLSVAEPLSVGLHAVARAGSLMGKRVLVTGSGPIGLLTARCAKWAGALEVVSTDIEDAALEVARTMGADRTINVARDSAKLEALKDHFDVAFEASGAAAALGSLFEVVQRGGRIIQVGMLPPGDAPVPVNKLQAREIEFMGAFRANGEFHLAVELIVAGTIDVSPILSGTYALADSVDAFERAGDRSRVVKLHIAMDPEFTA